MTMIGIRLKELRENRNLSQKKVAEALSISNVQLSRYESGDRKPDLDLITKFAEYYGVTTDYLLGRTAFPKYNPEENQIGIAFRDGGKNLTPDEEEYLERQLKEFREWRKRFTKNDK